MWAHFRHLHFKKFFQRYKINSMNFDPPNHSLKIWESLEIPIPKMGTHLGVCGLISSRFLAFLKVQMWFPSCTFGLHLSMPFALVTSLRIGPWQYPSKFQKICYGVNVFMRLARSYKYYWSTLRGVLHVYWIVLGMNNRPSIVCIPK